MWVSSESPRAHTCRNKKNTVFLLAHVLLNWVTVLNTGTWAWTQKKKKDFACSPTCGAEKYKYVVFLVHTCACGVEKKSMSCSLFMRARVVWNFFYISCSFLCAHAKIKKYIAFLDHIFLNWFCCLLLLTLRFTYFWDFLSLRVLLDFWLGTRLQCINPSLSLDRPERISRKVMWLHTFQLSFKK